jgi:hypothetical protein
MIGGSQHGNLGFAPPLPPSGLTMTIAYTGGIVRFYVEAVGQDIVIDWGDGSSSNIAAGTNSSSLSHSYASNGNYDVEIQGRGYGFFGDDYTTRHDWIDIKRWGTLFTPTNLGEMFTNCDNLQGSATDAADFDTSQATNAYLWFGLCSSFNGDLSNMDVSTITTSWDWDAGTTSWQASNKPAL